MVWDIAADHQRKFSNKNYGRYSIRPEAHCHYDSYFTRPRNTYCTSWDTFTGKHDRIFKSGKGFNKVPAPP